MAFATLRTVLVDIYRIISTLLQKTVLFHVKEGRFREV